MGSQATIKLIGSLSGFLDQSVKQPLSVSFQLHPSVKDLIESQGIPHTAIFKIVINGQEKGFDYNVHNGDQITIYPIEAIDEKELDSIFLSPESFIADVHLGKLAKTLRLLGFDTLLDQNWGDQEIIKQSNDQHRMILTRDVELLKNGNARYGYWVRSTNPDRQIEELFQRFHLADKLNAFSRCMKCNGQLNKVELDSVKNRVPPKVQKWHSTFFECTSCGQVYWQGSHYKKLEQKVAKLAELFTSQ